jgi:hypothetical protein
MLEQILCHKQNVIKIHTEFCALKQVNGPKHTGGMPDTQTTVVKTLFLKLVLVSELLEQLPRQSHAKLLS